MIIKMFLLTLALSSIIDIMNKKLSLQTKYHRYINIRYNEASNSATVMIISN